MQNSNLLAALLFTCSITLAADTPKPEPKPLPETLKTAWWKATAKAAPLLRDRERVEAEIAAFCKAQGQQAAMSKDTEELSCSDPKQLPKETAK